MSLFVSVDIAGLPCRFAFCDVSVVCLFVIGLVVIVGFGGCFGVCGDLVYVAWIGLFFLELGLYWLVWVLVDYWFC